MIILPVPVDPTDTDLAEALSMAVVCGWVGRGAGKLSPMEHSNQAFEQAEACKEEVWAAVRARPAQSRRRLDALLAAAIITGEVAKQRSPGQVLKDTTVLWQLIREAAVRIEGHAHHCGLSSWSLGALGAGTLVPAVFQGVPASEALDQIHPRLGTIEETMKRFQQALGRRALPPAAAKAVSDCVAVLCASAVSQWMSKGVPLHTALQSLWQENAQLMNKAQVVLKSMPLDCPSPHRWRTDRQSARELEPVAMIRRPRP